MGINDKLFASDELYELTGKKKLTRGEAVKAVWDYAKGNNLKTNKEVDGRNSAAIKSDKMLAPIIGKGVRTLGDISKGISKHLFAD